MQVGPTFDRAVRIISIVLAVVLLAGAGYLLVRGSQSSFTAPEGERGFLPTIERLLESPAPSEPAPPPAPTPTGVGCSGTPTIASFSAAPDSITPGGSATLSWSVQNAEAASITNIGDVDLTGSREVSPESNTKYVLTARCGTGKGSTASKGLSVTVGVVSSVSVEVDTNNYSGACPRTFTFTGKITVVAPTTVTYQWLRDGAAQGAQTLTFSAAGTQSVSHTWEVGNSGSYNAKLMVSAPNEKGNSATATVTCS